MESLPRHAGVLVETDRQPLQTAGGKEVQIAGHIGPVTRRVFRRQGLDHAGCQVPFRGEEGRGQIDPLGTDPGLVGLEDLATGQVELDAIAVVGDMAAGDHETRQALAETERGQRRAGDPAEVTRPITAVRHRLGAGLKDTASAGAIISRQGHFASRVKHADLHAVAQETQGVGVTDPVGHVHHPTPGPASAELHAALHHQIADPHPHLLAESWLRSRPVGPGPPSMPLGRIVYPEPAGFGPKRVGPVAWDKAEDDKPRNRY